MKYCSKVHNTDGKKCYVGDVKQPLDQFKSLRDKNKIVNQCLTCRSYHNKQYKRSKAGLPNIMDIKDGDMRPGNPPTFENDEHERLYWKWLVDLSKEHLI